MADESQFISLSQGREFAKYFASAYARELADVRSGLDPHILFVEPEPSLIFDISGDLLFYDFTITSKGTEAAQIRIAANINLGHPFVSLEGGKGRDTRQMVRTAIDLLYRAHPAYLLSEALPVCFNYPRIGIMLWVNSPEGVNSQLLFDPEFPDRGLRPIPEGAALIEGERVHSVLGEIPEGAAAPSFYFDLTARAIEDSKRQFGAAVPPNTSTKNNFVLKLSLPRAVDIADSILEVQESTDSILEVPYFAQESTDFCVLACLEMLNSFLLPERELSQQDIRGILAREPRLYGPGGVLPENQRSAFQRVFPPDQFDIVFEQNPSFDQAAQSIRVRLPFKSGISGHARVCVGFNTKEVGERASGTAVSQKAIYLNDPSGPSPRLELYQVEKLMPNGTIESSRLAIPIKLNAVLAKPRSVAVG